MRRENTTIIYRASDGSLCCRPIRRRAPYNLQNIRLRVLITHKKQSSVITRVFLCLRALRITYRVYGERSDNSGMSGFDEFQQRNSNRPQSAAIRDVKTRRGRSHSVRTRNENPPRKTSISYTFVVLDTISFRVATVWSPTFVSYTHNNIL